MLEEKFIFTSGAKKKIIYLLLAGIALTIIGIFGAASGGHHGDAHGAADAAAAAGHGFNWTQRLWADLWINNVYFVGLSVIGVFFVALQYVTQSGWSAPLKRIPEAFGYWLPIGGVLMLVVFLLANHDIFHWTHDYLYDHNDARYDHILDGKKAYLNVPFFLGRLVAYFAIWYGLFRMIRKASLAEDELGGDSYWYKMRKYSAIFIILFAVTSSMCSWDWVMSVDPHWFSTLFGWYMFSSWWVSGLAAIALIVIFLKESGYLKVVNENHLHDMGKFIFGFSIFWTYLWFSQFLLYYYANIPEETIYFFDRLNNDQYATILFTNLFLNFVFPFFALMTRESKRQHIILKVVCVVILIGHWLDFYLLITPGVLKENGSLGFLEIGLALIYLSTFLYVVLHNLAKPALIAKHHPMMKESLHHHI